MWSYISELLILKQWTKKNTQKIVTVFDEIIRSSAIFISSNVRNREKKKIEKSPNDEDEGEDIEKNTFAWNCVHVRAENNNNDDENRKKSY